MRCCSDPDSVARLDVLDLDPEVPPDALVRRDGIVWMNTAGRLYVSRNEGQIFVLAYQGWDCDGLIEGGGRDLDDQVDACERIGGVNFRSVEVQDGKGQRIGRLSSGPAITLEGVDYTDTPPVMRPLPPEKVEAARRAIDVITARQKGLAGTEWPLGWFESVCGEYRDRLVGNLSRTLPNTERGRRAAWELEGA